MRDILRLGVCGLGAVGRARIECLESRVHGARVVAVSDPNQETGPRNAAELALPYHPTPDDLLASEDVDGLIAASGEDAHEHVLPAAIRFGTPVYWEPPFTDDPETYRRILYAETAGGRRLVRPGLYRRADPGYRQLRAMRESGSFGRPLLVHAAHRLASVGKAFTTGHVLPRVFLHDLDSVRWLLGEELDTVQLFLPRSSRNAHPDLIDPQILVLTSRSGVWMHVESFLNCRAGCDIRCEMVFEEGIARLPDPVAASYLADGALHLPIAQNEEERFAPAVQTALQEWVDEIRSGHPGGGPSAWDGYAACIAVAAARQSWADGQSAPVNLPPCPVLYSRD